MSGSSGGHDSSAIVHNKIYQDDTITPFQESYALYLPSISLRKKIFGMATPSDMLSIMSVAWTAL